MPTYEYHCPGCKKDLTLTLSLREHDRGAPACPTCGKPLQPLLGSFFAKTSRKS